MSFLKGNPLGPWGGVRALSQLPLETLASVDIRSYLSKVHFFLPSLWLSALGIYTRFLWTATVFASDPVTAASLSGRDRATCLITIYPLQSVDCFVVCPVFWVIDLTWCGRSDFGVPRQGFEDLQRPFGQLLAIWPAFRVLRWLCEGPGHIKTEAFPLDCGHYCLYEPRFGMPVSH